MVNLVGLLWSEDSSEAALGIPIREEDQDYKFVDEKVTEDDAIIFRESVQLINSAFRKAGLGDLVTLAA